MLPTIIILSTHALPPAPLYAFATATPVSSTNYTASSAFLSPSPQLDVSAEIPNAAAAQPALAPASLPTASADFVPAATRDYFLARQAALGLPCPSSSLSRSRILEYREQVYLAGYRFQRRLRRRDCLWKKVRLWSVRFLLLLRRKR